MQNARALQVLARVKEKLTGQDFAKLKGVDRLGVVVEAMGGMDIGAGVGMGLGAAPGAAPGLGSVEGELNVYQQVDRLIKQATCLENLCQHYIGWCSFW